MGILSRLFSGKAKASEGEVRPGPYALSEGWLPAGTPWNFWQMGNKVRPYSAGSAMVEACVSAYSQTVAMCPGDHWRKLPNGGRRRVDNSPLANIIRRPNDYQSISDFLMNATRELYLTGEFFALAIRDQRGAVVAVAGIDVDAARVDLIKSASSKAGGCYLYANQRGCDGSRLYFDGGALVVKNGHLLLQGAQFSIKDVEVRF